MTHALTEAFGVVSLWVLDAREMTNGGNFSDYHIPRRPGERWLYLGGEEGWPFRVPK